MGSCKRGGGRGRRVGGGWEGWRGKGKREEKGRGTTVCTFSVLKSRKKKLRAGGRVWQE